jgi:HSP20 family molecular chaperone IbpA
MMSRTATRVCQIADSSRTARIRNGVLVVTIKRRDAEPGAGRHGTEMIRQFTLNAAILQ